MNIANQTPGQHNSQKLCELCEARRKAIEDDAWKVGFRWCPWCGARWRA